MKDTPFSIKKTLNIKGKLLSLEEPQVMGIINVTPDSFYHQSRVQLQTSVIKTAEKMLSSGARMLDIGGYSTRPGATDISVEEERSRVIPAIRDVKKAFPESILSIDTFRSEIAREAIEAGASMINDISGGQMDPEMFDTVAELKTPYILMHMRGDPKSMKTLTNYHNLYKEIAVYFNRKVTELYQKGAADIILDPGFGFAKTIDQNYDILKNLSYFTITGLPVLVGLSRKSMIYRTLHSTPEDALNGTTVLNTLALLKKASILRVHDVKEAVQIINLFKRGKL